MFIVEHDLYIYIYMLPSNNELKQVFFLIFRVIHKWNCRLLTGKNVFFQCAIPFTVHHENQPPAEWGG
jgi:hypothetical protein